MIINLSKIDFGGITGGKTKPEEVFDVQPTTTDQTITPTEGSVFSGGTVRAVTSAIDSNIQPENIKQGVSILGVAGTLSGGGGSDVFVVPPEMRFGYSTFTEIPSNWDFREFSSVTDLSYMFAGCHNLTTVPPIDTSNAIDASYMFQSCTHLTTIPLLDTSKVTNAHSMFSNCTRLTTIPLLDTSKVTSALYMFDSCTHLTTIPLLDTSKVTNAHSMFNYCSSLTTIPQLDFSSVTSAAYMFQSCSSLTTIPPLNTSKATSVMRMFSDCTSLTTVEGIDFSGLLAKLTYLFGTSTSMPNLTRFIVNGKINVNISDNYSIKALTAIDYESVKSILAAADRTDNTNAKTLAFNRTMTDQNGELAALVASCTSKGWTISGLTLN